MRKIRHAVNHSNRLDDLLSFLTSWEITLEDRAVTFPCFLRASTIAGASEDNTTVPLGKGEAFSKSLRALSSSAKSSSVIVLQETVDGII